MADLVFLFVTNTATSTGVSTVLLKDLIMSSPIGNHSFQFNTKFLLIRLIALTVGDLNRFYILSQIHRLN
jgi:hypothetical protein